MNHDVRNYKLVNLALSFIIVNDKILLARKARGFGIGKLNGYGGKIEKGETPIEAALRELEEESGMSCEDLVQRGEIAFYFHEEKVKFTVHVFKGSKINKDPVATEEMIEPTWYVFSDIPYTDMWIDDQYWLPELLEGKCFQARFDFRSMRAEHQNTIIEKSVEIVDDIG